MEEKTLDDGQCGSEEQQETKGFGDSTECGWMQGILGLSDSGDRCLKKVGTGSVKGETKSANFWQGKV